ncbi:MAG: hypothetical protein J5865_07035, partial [Lachnospiraceae bacterium]|nr:hypothetical protein [Lachnospiraceae bacterium]
MAEDIVPVLYARILKAFKNSIEKDKKIQTFEQKLKDKTATASEVSLYAAELGRVAAAVLSDALDPDNLPNRQLYWNIGQRTIKPLLKEVYKMVMAAAKEQTRYEDEAIGIHLNPVEPGFSEDRVDDLITKLQQYLQEDI